MNSIMNSTCMAFLNATALAVIYAHNKDRVSVNIVLHVRSKAIVSIVLCSKHIRWCTVETHDTLAKQQEFTINRPSNLLFYIIKACCFTLMQRKQLHLWNCERNMVVHVARKVRRGFDIVNCKYSLICVNWVLILCMSAYQQQIMMACTLGKIMKTYTCITVVFF